MMKVLFPVIFIGVFMSCNRSTKIYSETENKPNEHLSIKSIDSISSIINKKIASKIEGHEFNIIHFMFSDVKEKDFYFNFDNSSLEVINHIKKVYRYYLLSEIFYFKNGQLLKANFSLSGWS
ncbi:MAG: hypothetical protein ACJ748_11495, partial [Flavisolibacter sp.]